jgi:hypothetical protein
MVMNLYDPMNIHTVYVIITGAVSPGTGYSFRVWKIKSVLSVEPLMFFKFLFYVVSDIFKLIF